MGLNALHYIKRINKRIKDDFEGIATMRSMALARCTSPGSLSLSAIIVLVEYFIPPPTSFWRTSSTSCPHIALYFLLFVLFRCPITGSVVCTLSSSLRSLLLCYYYDGALSITINSAVDNSIPIVFSKSASWQSLANRKRSSHIPPKKMQTSVVVLNEEAVGDFILWKLLPFE